MKQVKVDQQTVYDGSRQTIPPLFKKTSLGASDTFSSLKRPIEESMIDQGTSKRPRVSEEVKQNILMLFDQAMRDYLTMRISTILKGGKDDIEIV